MEMGERKKTFYKSAVTSATEYINLRPGEANGFLPSSLLSLASFYRSLLSPYFISRPSFLHFPSFFHLPSVISLTCSFPSLSLYVCIIFIRYFMRAKAYEMSRMYAEAVKDYAVGLKFEPFNDALFRGLVASIHGLDEFVRAARFESKKRQKREGRKEGSICRQAERERRKEEGAFYTFSSFLPSFLLLISFY
jgi:hypothetical protein